MRRYARTLFPWTAPLLLLALLTSPLVAQKEAKTVKINITCKGGDQPAGASVKPQTVDVDQDQNIVWRLQINNSNRNDLTIEPKKPGLWPYEADKHTGQGEAKTLKMKPDAAGTYEYKIRYKCDDTDYLIDPRVRVGGGGD
jgi:hypothetical protein